MFLMAVSTAPGARVFEQRGVNFTAEGRGGYGGPRAIEILRELPKYGVNAIALVPYGMTRKGMRGIRFGGMERDDDILRIAQQAHALGMHVMLKPQIWIPGGFTGDLDFPTAEERDEWFASYREFIIHHAELAVKIKADIFCVGTEMSKLTRHESNWRKLIAEIRKLYKGALTYAAVQGPEFETLTFWDALDYIGLNNYYPLPEDLSTAAIVAKVEAVQRKFKKPVIFPEAGFASLEAPIERRGMRPDVSFQWKTRLAATRLSTKLSGVSPGSKASTGGKLVPTASEVPIRFPHAMGEAGNGSRPPLVHEMKPQTA